MFDRLQNLSMEFFGRRSAGDIVNCFSGDTEKIENSLAYGLIIILELGSILFSAILMFSLNWQLGLISCIGLTFCTLAPAKISTIVNLLTRLYDPDKGSILFDGVDLCSCTQKSLRDQIGLVSQEVILFNTSIRENIRMGYLEATDEEVETAAKDAEIHDFILTLPQGYDTPVGDRGGQLSGGQRQRIALARALVRNPAILILDEATSALDLATEAGILATIDRIAKERTVIMITHRITHALRANKIFVLENGTIVASGSHADLMQQKGIYATLWQQSNQGNNQKEVAVS